MQNTTYNLKFLGKILSNLTPGYADKKQPDTRKKRIGHEIRKNKNKLYILPQYLYF
jgi:hypothetical protein